MRSGEAMGFKSGGEGVAWHPCNSTSRLRQKNWKCQTSLDYRSKTLSKKINAHIQRHMHLCRIRALLRAWEIETNSMSKCVRSLPALKWQIVSFLTPGAIHSRAVGIKIQLPGGQQESENLRNKRPSWHAFHFVTSHCQQSIALF